MERETDQEARQTAMSGEALTGNKDSDGQDLLANLLLGVDADPMGRRFPLA